MIKRQPKEIILTSLLRTGQQGPFYIFTAFVFSYGTTVSHSSRNLLLTALLVATAISAVTIPLFGHVSDRIGRRRITLIGATAIGVWGFVYFALMNTANPGWVFLAIMLSLIAHDMMWGPQGAFIAECFTPRLRYSGFSLGGQFRLDHRGRPGAVDRDGAACLNRIGLRNCALYSVICRRHLRLGNVSAGSDEPRHLARGRLTSGQQGLQIAETARRRSSRMPGAAAVTASSNGGARRRYRNRWFADSPLEGNGFEFGVPAG